MTVILNQNHLVTLNNKLPKHFHYVNVEDYIHFEIDEIQIVVNKNTSPKTLVESFQNVYKELGSTGCLKLTE